MINILIAGSTGFVGNNLVDHLSNREMNVSALNRKRHTHKNIQQSFIWDDFSAESLTGIHTVIHLAGKAHDTKNTSVPAEYFVINSELTKTIFDTFLKSGARDFIYFSSVKAVAD